MTNVFEWKYEHVKIFEHEIWARVECQAACPAVCHAGRDVSVLRMVEGSVVPGVDSIATNWHTHRCILRHTAAHMLVFCCQAVVRRLSGCCQAACQGVFRTSRAAIVIEGSIVRLEPSVEAVWNSQACRICLSRVSDGFQCFLPVCQANLVILRGLFRHLDLQQKCIRSFLVCFSIKICIQATTFEKISKSYSHVFF